MLKTKGAAIFNTHERPIKICMHKTEGLKRQALKGMFSLMYITNSLLKNKRMLYEYEKLVAYYIKASCGFHLYLLIFPFVYQFNSRIEVLVHSSLGNKNVEMTSSERF